METSIHTITKQTIGKVTYRIASISSKNATVTLDKKIKKIIEKDVQKTALERRF